jgi:glycosyltransferase involved in cell wall biosynthesis
MDISIVLCCYNSAQRIAPTLEHLARQRSSTLKLEIILVDNNCTDTTVTSAVQVWVKCGNPFPLKIIEESTPGLSSARKAGVYASSGEIIIFCDDDNWLDIDYAWVAYNIMKENSAIGVLGGRSYPTFSIEPPHWFTTYQEGYAVGVQGFFNSGFDFFCADREGDKLSSGGDSELCQWHLLVGLKLWYDERLIFSHYIPENRLTKTYLSKIHAGFSASSDYLKKYRYLNRAINMQRDGIFIKGLKVSLMLLRYITKIIDKEEAVLHIQTIFPDRRIFSQDPVLRSLWSSYINFKSNH